MFCDVVPSSRAFNLAYLDVIDGPARGLWYGLAGQNVTIGRDVSCAISIADSRISRRHLQIAYERSSGRHLAVDVGSSNGVSVNGTRLRRGVQLMLEDGDEIGIGGSKLRYMRDALSTWVQPG
ncbi:MAG: pSer/pThr/pTyr-binding forkhead associated (FHA) protein [Planctomycetota bacterium]